MNGEIYIIKNYINNKVYVGQTTQGSEVRFKQHLKLLKSNQKQLICKAIKKYGKENFYYEILEENIDNNLLDEREEYWISYYDSYNYGYNLCKGGNQSRKPQNSILSEKHDEIIYRYTHENISLRKLSEEYQVTHNTLSRFLIKNGIDICKRNKSALNLSEEDKRLIADLFNKGKTDYEIAKEMNRNVKTIRRYKNYKYCA